MSLATTPPQESRSQGARIIQRHTEEHSEEHSDPWPDVMAAETLCGDDVINLQGESCKMHPALTSITGQQWLSRPGPRRSLRIPTRCLTGSKCLRLDPMDGLISDVP